MKKLFASIFMLFSLTAFAGENLADISFKNLDNQTVTLEQYKGKKLYIKTWASWCPICLAGLPEIDDLSGEPNKDFSVVTVVSPEIRGEKPTADFIEWFKGLEYKNIVVLLDENGELIKRAKVRGYPSSVFVDENLNVQKVFPGHLDAEKVKSLIK